MGVEYTHGLFVADLQWRPRWEHVEAVHAVLERWGLASGPVRLLSATGGPSIARGAGLPDNSRVQFGGVTDRAAIERAMGPSETRGERRLGIVARLGVDFHVLQADSLDIELLAPAVDGDDEVEPDDTGAYPASWTTTPPVTRGGEASGFTGVYRSAILFHCDKDVPNFQHQNGVLPDPALRAQLEVALGTALVEAGWID